jgi:hypothetical protein
VLYERQRREAMVSIDEPEEEEQPKGLVHSYAPPVDRLLTYTSIQGDDPLPKEVSYVELFGIGAEHIPELIRMATDEYLGSEDASEFEFAAPLHAVRALAELRAEEAIEPLLTIYDKAGQNNNDWMLETLTDVYTSIGPAALPALEQFLVDPSHDDGVEGYITEIIGKIVKEHPETRTECVAMLMRRLAEFEENDPDLNSFLVWELLRVKAVEAAPLMEEAFASDCVNEFWCGDWNEAQYQLGLKERPPAKDRESILRERLGPRTRPLPGLSSISSISSTPTPAPSTTTPVHKPTKKSSASKKGKTKIKMVKASRKTNRRKR